MRLLILAATLVLLAGCAGVLDNCPDGLAGPPAGSSIPDPHR
jgi:hypothetical protein